MLKNKVYFAGPLFNEAERAFNQNLTSKIENIGFTVFLPQRDSAELNKPPFDGITQTERNKAVLSLNINPYYS